MTGSASRKYKSTRGSGHISCVPRLVVAFYDTVSTPAAAAATATAAAAAALFPAHLLYE